MFPGEDDDNCRRFITALDDDNFLATHDIIVIAAVDGVVLLRLRSTFLQFDGAPLFAGWVSIESTSTYRSGIIWY